MSVINHLNGFVIAALMIDAYLGDDQGGLLSAYSAITYAETFHPNLSLKLLGYRP